jgi:hypothetical protein
MYGALLVIPLVALVIPILLLLAALVFDVGVVFWALYRTWHDQLAPRLWSTGRRVVTPHAVRRPLVRPLAHR